MTDNARRRIIPGHFVDPWGLAWRLLRSRSPEAYQAAASTALTLLCRPLELALRGRESRLREAAEAPELPIIFVCGPPRSGTTLVSQFLIKALPVAYTSNLMSIFPGTPIAATTMFSARQRPDAIRFESYYGKTRGLHGPNDFLPLWDRWFGEDRATLPEALTHGAEQDMRQFFGALQAIFGRPVLNKNNSLNLLAHLVAPVLETAVFVCMERDPLFLGQSLLLARRQIQGSDDVPYGPHADWARGGDRDVFDDVSSQVVFHSNVAELQQSRIGNGRFWRISYEAFCADPVALAERVAREALGQPMGASTLDALQSQTPSFPVSAERKLPADEFARLERSMTAHRSASDSEAETSG